MTPRLGRRLLVVALLGLTALASAQPPAALAATVERLRARAGPPGAGAGDLIAAVYTDAPDRCRVLLRQGHIDPLALMTFKVLPASRPEDESFARHPVGSGPFVYAGPE